MKIRNAGWMIFGTLLGLGACVGDPDATENETEVFEQHEAIRNGNEVDATALGMVAITSQGDGSHGSGSLLTPEWVLTAGHVVDDVRQRPSELVVTLGSPFVAGMPQRRAAAIYIHPAHTRGVGSSPQLPNEVDVALVRLAEPFPSDVFNWPLSAAAKSTLLNKNVACLGYGLSNELDPASADKLREAGTLKIKPISTNSMQVNQNASAQIFLKGDSGGNCRRQGEIIGVISTVDPNPPVDFGHVVPVDSFRDWVSGIMNSCSASTPGLAGFCSAACPCQYGSGDCNANSGCNTGLVCENNVGLNFGLTKTSDVCVDKACAGVEFGSPGACTLDCPCGQGGGGCTAPVGDIATDHKDCQIGLVCDEKVGPAFRMAPDVNVCVSPQCSLKTLGADDFCTPDCPCGQGGGDCDTDADCMRGLICAQDFGAAYGYKGITDVCMPAACKVGPFILDGFCTPACPCGVGGGDCDSDADCMPGLICGSKNGAKFGQNKNWDMCVRP